MRSITVSPTTTVDEYISAQWSNDPATGEMFREMLNYRNRLRWANVMPALARVGGTGVTTGPGHEATVPLVGG